MRPMYEGTEFADTGPVLGKIAALAAAAARSCSVSALVAPTGDDVRMLLSLGRLRDSVTVVEQIASEIHRHALVVVAAGGVVDDPGSASRSIAEAGQVLAAVRVRDRDRTVHRLEDVHIHGLIHLPRDDERLRLFADRELAPLLEHDACGRGEQRGSLVDTVRALLAHPHSKAAAAASLHISRPVLYDRLAKAERLLGADLADGEVRTSLHLALLTQCADDAIPSTCCSVGRRAVLCKRWRKELRLPGPPGSTLRGRGPKPLQGALVKSQGLERCRKRRRNLRQVCTTKMSESEPSDDASSSGMLTSEPGPCVSLGMSLAGRLVPGQTVSGVKAA